MKNYQKAKPYYHPDTAEFGIMFYNMDDEDKAFCPLGVKQATHIWEGCSGEIARFVRQVAE